jgi:poly-gamma-glutamate capsule biosynthesis protein CapA/YwtB (metallophosphatase superfamily)
MFEIDNKNLIIRNKKIINKKKFTTINITSDWAPIIDEVSDLIVKKKYYGNLLPFFKNGDLNITNLETVIDFKKRKFNKNALKFINKPKILGSLTNINTNLVCLANNHIMDNGDVGLKNTIKYLKKYKINHVGAESSLKKIYKPFFFKKNNHKIAVINTSEGEEANEKYNNHVGSSDIESYKVIDQIRSCKENGYLTILIAHAGVEYIPFPPPYIKDIYKNFVDEGADLVVGHHPHVLQGFEIYKKVPIFYSLGNFTMWKKNLRKNCYDSMFLNIKIQDNKISSINLVPFKINKNGLNLVSKSEFSKKIIELNNFLSKSDKIWLAYLNRKNSKKNFFSEYLSFFYNFSEHKNQLINKYTNLSKKYSDLDYMKNEFQKNYNYEYILDKWQIKKNNDLLSLFKNIFHPLYKIVFIIKKTIKNLKMEFFR